MAVNPLLAALGIGGATIGGGAALHGLGLGQLLSPLDMPRQSLYNLFAAPYKALETGDASHLLGAIPGAAGAILGGLVGGPAGVLAGSALGGTLQGLGQATGREEFSAPSVQDLTGTEDFLPNLAVGMATDPLSYAGLSGTWRAAKGAATPISGAVKAAEEAIPVAKLAEPIAASTGQIASSAVPVAKTAEEVAPVFYSRLEQAIQGLPDRPLKAQSVMNMLEKAPGGIAKEEVEWTRMRDALAGKKTVTKEELLNHFKQNEVQVKEVWKGKDHPEAEMLDAELNKLYTSPESRRREELLRRQMAPLSERQPALTRDELAELDRLTAAYDTKLETTNDKIVATRPKHSGYQTPGGEDYKELLLTLPKKEVGLPEGWKIVQDEAAAKQGRNSFQIVDDRGVPQYHDAYFNNKDSAAAYVASRKPGVQQNYHSGHWEEPNVLAHVRMNDRVGPAGEKILHVEEVQSDWHQGGKKGAYEGTPKAEEVIALRDEKDRLIAHANELPMDDPAHGAIDKRVGEIEKAIGVEGEGAQVFPSAPFKENWHELAMKRVIRYAAENGYDAVSLNPGEQINKILGGDKASLGGQKAFYGSAGNPSMVKDAEKLMALSESNPAAHAEAAKVRDANKATAGALPNWMQKYAKQYGVKVEPGQIAQPGLRSLDDIAAWDSVLNKISDPVARNAAFKAKNAAGDYDAVLRILQENGVSVPAELRQGMGVPVTQLPLNQKMRESVLFKGQPLMSLAALAGGGPLLAALMGERS